MVKKYVRSILTVLLTVMLIIPVTTVKAETPDDSYNLGTISGTLANVFNVSRMPRDTDDGGALGVPVLSGTNTGNAGLVLGYTTDETSVGSWVMSMISGTSASTSYRSLRNIPYRVYNEDGTYTVAKEGTDEVYHYAVYGHLLKSLGLDKTATNTTNGLSIGRFFKGGTLLIAYNMAMATQGLMQLSIRMLQAINPFNWFRGIVKNAGHYSLDAWGGGTRFGPLIDAVSTLYVLAENMSWGVVIPFAIGLFLFNFFIRKKSSGIRPLALKILFAAVGVPIMGVCYTGILDEMTDSLEQSQIACSQIIASNMIDFQSWAQNGHLGIPDGAILRADVKESTSDDHYDVTAAAGVPTRVTQTYLKRTCYMINSKYGVPMPDADGYGLISDNSTSAMISNADRSAEEFSSKEIQAYINNLIMRYMAGNFYMAENYASYVQTEELSDDNYSMLKDTAYYGNYGDGFEPGGFAMLASKIRGTNTGYMSANGYDLANTAYAGGTTIFNDGSLKVTKYGDDEDSVYDVQYYYTSGKQGLSTLSMYNYLNSDFRSEDVMLYSGNNRVASGLTKQQHYAVNLVGTGLQEWTSWADMVIPLGCLSLIAIAYSLGMLSHSIKNAIAVVSNMPMAVMGAVPYMAQFIGGVMTMIVNVVASVILYQFCQAFLFGLMQFIEDEFMGFFTSFM